MRHSYYRVFWCCSSYYEKLMDEPVIHPPCPLCKPGQLRLWDERGSHPSLAYRPNDSPIGGKLLIRARGAVSEVAYGNI
jgi:hypothetical protein